MNTFNTSPGVYTTEHDYSQRVARVSSTIGVVVGESERGPVNERTLITSEADFIKIFGKPNVAIGYSKYCALSFLEQANQLYFTRVAPEALYGGIVIYWQGLYNRSRQYEQGLEKPDEYPFESADLFTIYAINPGDWNNDIYVQVYPDTRIEDGSFWVDVYQKGRAIPVERWNCHLTIRTNGFGVQQNVQEQINNASNYIRVKQNRNQADFQINPNKQFINSFDAGSEAAYPGIRLNGGNSGRRPTVGELILAWDLYHDKEEVFVTILMDGGYTIPDIQRRIDAICKHRMDCVGIFSVPYDRQSTQKAIQYRRIELMLDSNYSALYGSWLKVGDKYNDISLPLPPTGHVAAAYARTDRDYDTWFAPAGMERGSLNCQGVVQVYDQGMRNQLYESQINAIRVIEGAGIKIFGADTLQIIPSALSNMSVRRLLITLETSLERVLLFSIFDPNSQLLRSRLSSMAEKFLQDLQNAQALYGFSVQCDDSNNPPSSIANGDLNLAMWVDPTLPIKRLFLNAIMNRTGVKVIANV